MLRALIIEQIFILGDEPVLIPVTTAEHYETNLEVASDSLSQVEKLVWLGMGGGQEEGTCRQKTEDRSRSLFEVAKFLTMALKER